MLKSTATKPVLKLAMISISAILGTFALISIAILAAQPLFLIPSFVLSIWLVLFLLVRIRSSIKLQNEQRETINKLNSRLDDTETLLSDCLDPIRYYTRMETALANILSKNEKVPRFQDIQASPFEKLRLFCDSFKHRSFEQMEFLNRLSVLPDLAGVVQAMELRLPYVFEIFKRVVEHTEQAALVLIDRFSSISDRTSKADTEAHGAILALGIEGNTNDGLAALINRSHESITARSDVIYDFIKLNHDNVDRVKKISDLVTKSEDLISGIEDITERSKLIAFNMAVESAKIGEKGQGFRVIVRELQNLNDQTTRFARNIMDIVKSFKIYNKELLDLWLSKSESLTERVRMDNVEAETSIKALKQSYDVSQTLFRSLSESAIEVNRAMADILSSLQFQDITRQQIEGAASFLTQIEQSLKMIYTSFQTFGLPLQDEKEILKAIRTQHEPQLKVSKDHDIFDFIERSIK